MSNIEDTIVAGKNPFAYFVEMDWNGKKERFWSGLGIIDWQHEGDSESRVWHGTGQLGRFKLPENSGEVQVDEMTFTLSGVDFDQKDEGGITIRDRLNEDIRGGVVTVWLAFLNIDFTISCSKILQNGILDRSEWNADGANSSVTVYARGVFAFLETQIAKKWSVETQNDYLSSLGIDPATDTGFDQMHLQKDNPIAWLPD